MKVLSLHVEAANFAWFLFPSLQGGFRWFFQFCAPLITTSVPYYDLHSLSLTMSAGTAFPIPLLPASTTFSSTRLSLIDLDFNVNVVQLLSVLSPGESRPFSLTLHVFSTYPDLSPYIANLFRCVFNTVGSHLVHLQLDGTFWSATTSQLISAFASFTNIKFRGLPSVVNLLDIVKVFTGRVNSLQLGTIYPTLYEAGNTVG